MLHQVLFSLLLSFFKFKQNLSISAIFNWQFRQTCIYISDSFYSTLHTYTGTSDELQLPRRSIKLVCCRTMFSLKVTYHFLQWKTYQQTKSFEFLSSSQFVQPVLSQENYLVERVLLTQDKEEGRGTYFCSKEK